MLDAVAELLDANGEFIDEAEEIASVTFEVLELLPVFEKLLAFSISISSLIASSFSLFNVCASLFKSDVTSETWVGVLLLDADNVAETFTELIRDESGIVSVVVVVGDVVEEVDENDDVKVLIKGD